MKVMTVMKVMVMMMMVIVVMVVVMMMMICDDVVMMLMMMMLNEISHIPSLDYSLASQSKRPVHFIRLLLNFPCVYTSSL